jgi:predicted Zn-dependent peptidase
MAMRLQPIMGYLKTMKKVLLVICLTLAACHSGLCSYETGGVVKTILSNGVTLLVKREPESPVAAVEILVRVGAQDERSKGIGIGQLLAGSILAGSTTRPTFRLAQLAAQAGGNFHSVWQWNYIETYAVTLPNACDEAISLLSDAVQNSSLDPEAIERSRSAILKEIGREVDDPFNSAYTEMRELLFRYTPYGRAYLGNPEDVRSITAGQVRAFYEKNFTADRVVICVVGNVNTEAIGHRVEVCFSNMDLSNAYTAAGVAAHAAKPAVVVKTQSTETYIMVGFPAPGIEDKDYLPMCIVNVLLGGNKSSLLFSKLREEKGLGYQVGSQFPALSGASSIVAFLDMDSARATPDTIKEVELTIREQAKALCDGQFTDRDLERAKSYLIGKHALDHERTRDRAFHLAWSESMGLGYQADLPESYADAVNHVTKAEVVQACRRFLAESGQ